MALNETQEALLEGASALRYKAERLASLSPSSESGSPFEMDPAMKTRVDLWREQAETLDRIAAVVLVTIGL